MTDHLTDTTTEDEAFLAGARRLQEVLRHPFALGFLGVVAAALLFRAGMVVGDAAYHAFDGDAARAITFGVGLVAFVLVVVGVGVWLDRRRRARDVDAAPHADAEQDQP